MPSNIIIDPYDIQHQIDPYAIQHQIDPYAIQHQIDPYAIQHQIDPMSANIYFMTTDPHSTPTSNWSSGHPNIKKINIPLNNQIDLRAIQHQIDLHAIQHQIDLHAIQHQIDLHAIQHQIDLHAIQHQIDLHAIQYKIDSQTIQHQYYVESCCSNVNHLWFKRNRHFIRCLLVKYGGCEIEEGQEQKWEDLRGMCGTRYFCAETRFSSLKKFLFKYKIWKFIKWMKLNWSTSVLILKKNIFIVTILF